MVRHFSQVVARTVGNEHRQSMQQDSQKSQRPLISFLTLRIGVAVKDFNNSFSMKWSSSGRGGTCFTLQTTHSVHSMTFSQHSQRSSSSSVHAALGGTPPGIQLLPSISMFSSSSSPIAGAESRPRGVVWKTPTAAEAGRLERAGFSSKNPFRMAGKERRE